MKELANVKTNNWLQDFSHKVEADGFTTLQLTLESLKLAFEPAEGTEIVIKFQYGERIYKTEPIPVSEKVATLEKSFALNQFMRNLENEVSKSDLGSTGIKFRVYRKQKISQLIGSCKTLEL